jgi:hypothetical protein
MCERTDGAKAVCDAAIGLTVACLSRLPLGLLRDEGTVYMLPRPAIDFDALLALLDEKTRD